MTARQQYHDEAFERMDARLIKNRGASPLGIPLGNRSSALVKEQRFHSRSFTSWRTLLRYPVSACPNIV
jgi:hypothetical protein